MENSVIFSEPQVDHFDQTIQKLNYFKIEGKNFFYSQ